MIPSEHTAYQSAIQRVLEELPQTAQKVEEQFFVARRELEELLATPRQARPRLLNRAKAGFRTSILVDLLLHRSRALLAWDSEEALDRACWAFEVAQRLPANEEPSDVVATTLARAGAHLGNCLRARGELKAAEERIERALETFDRHGTGDILVEAEILELSALLRISQRRLEEAEALMGMALSLYEECEAFEHVGPALVEKATALGEVGEHTLAVDSLEEALAHLEIEHNGEVCSWALQNQVFYLLQVDLPIDAAEVLRTMPAPSGPATPWLEARQLWLELEMARQRERATGLETGERALREAIAALALSPALRNGSLEKALGLGLPWNGGALPPR